MRQSSSVARCLLAFSLSLSLSSFAQKRNVSSPAPAAQAVATPANAITGLTHGPECSLKTTYPYPDNQCTITYYRDQATITSTYTVPPDTTVYFRIIGQHPFETPTTKITTTLLAPLDIFGSFVKNFVSPISAVTIRTSVGKALQNDDVGKIEYDELALKLKIDDANAAFNHVKLTVTCLQTGLVVDDVNQKSCKKLEEPEKSAAGQDIRDALTSTINELAATAWVVVPAKDELTPIQKLIDTRKALCKTQADVAKCQTEMAKAQVFLMNLGLSIDDALAAQKSLGQIYAAIRALSYTAPTTEVFHYKTTANHGDTVKTSVVDALTTTSTDIASTTINAQYTRFVISTGVMFSTLKNKTFANAPIIVDGQPVLDSSGKALTQVVVNTTRPSVVFPLVLFSVRALSITTGCKGNCSVLFSGGVGANLSSKTADFAVGPSFQWGSVLMSPVLHYGRQTALTNGVTVGQRLGSSPPTLPTNNEWKPAFGFSIGYVIPIGAIGASK